jgi:hypothetical protein
MDSGYEVGDAVDTPGGCGRIVRLATVPDSPWAIVRVRLPDGREFPLRNDSTLVEPCEHHLNGGGPPLAPPLAAPVSPAVAAPVAAAPAAVPGALPGVVPNRPTSMDGVIATFGDPGPYVNDKAAWEARVLDQAALPQPLVYAYDQHQPIRRVRAHRFLVTHLADTLMACLQAGVPPQRLKYGGSYSWRVVRGGSRLSLHTWGIAVDVEPAENPLGEEWVNDGRRLDPRVIDVFKARGWFWGGDFQRRADPQHFQWASGT